MKILFLSLLAFGIMACGTTAVPENGVRTTALDDTVWDFTVPEGATATVTLPGESESKEYTAGNYTIKK